MIHPDMKDVLESKTSRYINIILYILFISLFVSLAFWWRAVSSISIGLIFLLVIFKKIAEQKSLLPGNVLSLFILGCAAFYLFQFISCIDKLNDPLALKHLRIKSALLFIPIVVAGSGFINDKNRDKLLSFFTVAVLASSLFCIVAATTQFFQTKDPLSFFYYELVKPFFLSCHLFFYIGLHRAGFFIGDVHKKAIFISPLPSYRSRYLFFCFYVPAFIPTCHFLVYILYNLSLIGKMEKKDHDSSYGCFFVCCRVSYPCIKQPGKPAIQ
jgi:hypothetical protein